MKIHVVESQNTTIELHTTKAEIIARIPIEDKETG